MNLQTHLTYREKIMNMAKLGIVSAAANQPAKLIKPNNGGASVVDSLYIMRQLNWSETERKSD